MISFSLSDVQKLEAEFGSPLYVFDKTSFIENYHELEGVLKECYPQYQTSYSFKTNYTPHICSLVRELGGYAEVVSGMEYEIAKRTCYTSDKIIFNGPNKGEEGLLAVLNGSIVNIDNLDELHAVCSKIKEYPDQNFKIGLRANIEVGQNFISRFGMDEEDIEKAFNKVELIPNLRIVGLHCHISRCRGIDAWRRRTEIMLGLADRFFEKMPPKYIDLGSGMFGKMDPDFAAQFDVVPSYKEYAAVTAKIVADHYKYVDDADKPIVFTEPGTTLVNKYFDFVGKVDAIKTVRGKSFAILNCSEHNLGETCTLKKLPVRVIRAAEQTKQYSGIDLVGYTCLEQDIMYTNFNGVLGIGDYVQFGNVGGYSNVYKPPFIWPNCAMIVKKENNEYQVIKHKESYKDLLKTYMF